MDWLVFSQEVHGRFIYIYIYFPGSSFNGQGEGPSFMYHIWTRFRWWWHLVGNRRVRLSGLCVCVCVYARWSDVSGVSAWRYI